MSEFWEQYGKPGPDDDQRGWELGDYERSEAREWSDDEYDYKIIVSDDGEDETWFRSPKGENNFVLHRDGAPAVIKHGKIETWMQDGKTHRENGPAVLHIIDGTTDSAKFWFKNHIQYREGGLPSAVIPHMFVSWFKYSEGMLMAHKEDGPYVVDGVTGEPVKWALNNVEVPDWLVTTPAMQLDAEKIFELENVEVRREFVRKIGIDVLVARLGSTVVDAEGDYELIDLKISKGQADNEESRRRYLKMKNPSIGVFHVEGVPNSTASVRDALLWRNAEALEGKDIADDGEDWYQQGDVIMIPRGANRLKPVPKVLT